MAQKVPTQIFADKVWHEGLVLTDRHPSLHVALGNPEAHRPSRGQIQSPGET